MFVTTQSCKRQSGRQLSLGRRDSGQPEEDQNEQQQQQPANHSSGNAETARYLTPFSHPEANRVNVLNCCRNKSVNRVYRCIVKW